MKFKFSTLVAGALAGLLCIATGCARVDELDNRVTDLEKKFADLNPRLSSYEEQIRTLTEFKTTIEGMDLQGKFNAINQETAKIAGIITRLDNLDGAEGEIARIKAELAALEGQGAQTIYDYIDKQIQSLSNRIKNDSTALETYKKSTDQTLKVIINEILYMGEDGEIYSYIELLINAVLGIWDDIDALYGNDGFLYGKIFGNADSIDVLAGEIAKLADLYGELQTTCGDLNSRLSAIEADYLTKTAFDQYTRSAGEKAAAFAQKMKLDSTMFANNIEKLDAKIKLDSILFAGQIRDLAAKERQDSALLAGKIKDLEDKNIEIGNDINKLNVKVAALEDADSLLQDQIDSTVNRVTTLEEKVEGLIRTVGLLPDDIKGFTEQVAKHDEAINDLNGYVQDLQGRMIKVEDLLAHRIQSLVYVPDYRDGKITIYTEVLKANDTTEVNLDDVTTGINYQVKPANLADTLVAAWKACALKVSFDAARVETRGADIKGVIAFDEIIGVKVADKENGIITITVDPNDSTVAHGYVNNSAIALVLSDENGNSRTTEYTNTTTKGGQRYEIVFQKNHTFADTLVSMPYNKTDVATFFGNVEPLFRLVPKGAETGEAYTVAGLAALGHNIAPYVEIANEVIYPEENETNFEVADDSTKVSVNLISDRAETAKSVGDTLKVIKKMYVKGAVDTCKARASFAVTPISLYADFSTTVTWNLEEDAKGDVYTYVRGNIRNAWKNYGPHKNLPVTLDATNLEEETGFNPAVFSHTDTLPGTYKVRKIKGTDTTAVTGAELTAFKIDSVKMAPVGNEPNITLDLKGFDFTADKYIVTAKYLPKYEGVTESKDTTDLSLVINVVDRDRDMIVEHTYPTQTLNVTKGFGGKVRIHLQKEGAEWEYFSALLDSLDQDSTLEFADFANKYNVDNKSLAYALVDDVTPAYDNTRFELVCNTADSITFDVKYTTADIESTYDTGFTVKDTITLGGGQKVAIEIPFVFNWPEYNFKRSEYYVNKDGNNQFYSEVEPFYGHDGKSVGKNAAVIDSFDVYKVNLKQCFPTLFKKGVVAPVDPKAEGLVITYAFAKNPVSSSITIENDTLLKYHGADAKVYVKPVLVLKHTGGAVDTLKTNFEFAPFGGNEYYSDYYVKRYEPFRKFSQKTPSVTFVNEPKKYEVNVRELMSLTDARGKECLDANQKSTVPHYWVAGNGTNGFANGTNAGKIYRITATQLTLVQDSSIDPVIAKQISFDSATGILTFDNSGELTLQKDVEVNINAKIDSEWGTYEIKQADGYTKGLKVVFKAPLK